LSYSCHRNCRTQGRPKAFGELCLTHQEKGKKTQAKEESATQKFLRTSWVNDSVQFFADLNFLLFREIGSWMFMTMPDTAAYKPCLLFKQFTEAADPQMSPQLPPLSK
jgi:hypothetical protein